MPRSPIQHILDDATPLKRDVYGNPRYHIPYIYFPVSPGAQAANDIGLYKYRGRKLRPGFVIQSYALEEGLLRVLDALDGDLTSWKSAYRTRGT